MAAADEKDNASGHWPTVRDSWVEEMPGTPSTSLAVAAAAAAQPATPAEDAPDAATEDAAPPAGRADPPDIAPPPPSVDIPPPPKTMPPPLPGSDPMLKVSDPRRVDLMFERLAANDYEGALLVAQAVLARVPHDQDALECAEMSARELWRLHEQRLGSLDRIPQALVAPDALPPSLNLRAGFLLARVDGVATIAEIVNRAGLPLIDALRGMAELYLVGAIGFGRG
jgi:hypothetical protein